MREGPLGRRAGARHPTGELVGDWDGDETGRQLYGRRAAPTARFHALFFPDLLLVTDSSMGVPPSLGPSLPSPPFPIPVAPESAHSRPLLLPGTSLCLAALSLRGSEEVQEVGWPWSLRAEPAQTPAPASEYFIVGQREGRGADILNPPPPPSPSGSNLPCIVTTARNEAGEAGLQLAIEPLALQTEGLGLLQIHFYFPGQRLYSLLA